MSMNCASGTRGSLKGGCVKILRNRRVAVSTGLAPTKKTRGLDCGRPALMELADTARIVHPVGNSASSSCWNHSPNEVPSSLLLLLRMPATFSTMQNESLPCLAQWMIHAHTVRKTQLRESISRSRLPMLDQGGHGGPLMMPSADRSRSASLT